MMNFGWLSWSDPVAVWWFFLVAVSAINIGLWFWLRASLHKLPPARPAGAFNIEPLLMLAAAYVFCCAFRSMLPRADVQRICLFDTWLSSVLIGRSVATVAELCFVAQWAIVLHALGNFTNSDTVRNVSRMIVPLIVLAECCSWYAVITTNYLGNVLENSLWTVTFAFIAVALVRLLFRFRGIVRLAIAVTTAGTIGYVVFMCTVDVPMYFSRWQAEMADGAAFLSLFAGLHDVATRWIVTHDIAAWKDEVAWMSLYFSAAVWASLGLAGLPLVWHLLPRYTAAAPLRKPQSGPLAVAVRSSRQLTQIRRPSSP